jgi:hypothetical protein
MPGFQQQLDIQNKAVYHLGGEPIASASEISKNNRVTTDLYNLLVFNEQERNRWRFGTKEVALRAITSTTLKFTPEIYSSTATYQLGEICTDSSGVIWQSVIPNNLNNTPGTFTVGTPAAWQQYFGSLTADVWNNPGTNPNALITTNDNVNSSAYFAGELCYLPVNGPGSGGGTVDWSGEQANGLVCFLSKYNNNDEQPSIVDVWNATTTYNADDVVQDPTTPSLMWRSLIPQNLNNTPATAPVNWSSVVAYTTGQTVTAYDGFVYKALQNNTGVDPVQDAISSGGNWGKPTSGPTVAAWVATTYQVSTKWIPIRGVLSPLFMTFPIGCGPVEDSTSKNIYHLPAAYLRMAPQDPKAGSTSILGAPTGIMYNDWELEDEYICSRDWTTIILRFQAKVADVRRMNSLFCEALSLRIAYDGCEALTQSTEKQAALRTKYNEMLSKAQLINAIETGAEEPPLDDYIATRL